MSRFGRLVAKMMGRKKKPKSSSTAPSRHHHESDHPTELESNPVDSAPAHELPAPMNPHSPVHESSALHPIHELSAANPVHELAASNPVHEPSNPVYELQAPPSPPPSVYEPSSDRNYKPNVFKKRSFKHMRIEGDVVDTPLSH